MSMREECALLGEDSRAERSGTHVYSTAPLDGAYIREISADTVGSRKFRVKSVQKKGRGGGVCFVVIINRLYC